MDHKHGTFLRNDNNHQEIVLAASSPGFLKTEINILTPKIKIILKTALFYPKYCRAISKFILKSLQFINKFSHCPLLNNPSRAHGCMFLH
jgi:hypothetical protein